MPRKMTCVVFTYCSFLVLLLPEMCKCCSEECSLKCWLLSELPAGCGIRCSQGAGKELSLAEGLCLTLCISGLKTGQVLIVPRVTKCWLGKLKLFIYSIWESLSLQSSAVSQLCAMTVSLCLGVISLVQQAYHTTTARTKLLARSATELLQFSLVTKTS